MTMIRISTTWLDSFLYWQSAEDMPVEELIARFKGEEPPTPQMRAGQALHALLEDISASNLFTAHKDGFSFRFDIDASIPIAPIKELKGEQIIETRAGRVNLVGKVDALHGRLIRDYKLTERFDAERYADSYQWRAYLMMFDARMFVYDVFTGKVDGTDVRIYGYDELPLYAYPGMEADVQRVTGELAELIARYWPERVAA